ncbi:MAG: outer membrane lipoprotein carrier protein LolA [Chitinophagaceae bacterium]|nr:outer membrane lipoprotein carrier protein LolA [Chitinophagaceae bacterium]MBL0055108.1 outer membrane lipoprotein carrier protein LolA [Chitinophagaceae bacterium]
MRKLFFILTLLLAGIRLTAQYTGYTPIADPVKFREQFSAASLKTNSIKSDFVQEKNLSMLSEKIISKGKFWFKKAGMVRMEYNHPFQYLMIINKDKVFIRDGQKENKVSSKSNKLFQQINRIMVDCMQGTALNNTDFKTRVFEGRPAYLVELTPVVKGLKEMFRTITVYIDKKDFSVINLEMLELSGDNTSIRFNNKELNTTLTDALFTIQ